jgi:sugar phosphate isomerase/epimerase
MAKPIQRPFDVEKEFRMSMPLSLSVRIVEAPCKTKLHLPFEELVSLAAESGYSAICMRASAGGVQTPKKELRRMKDVVDQHGLRVSMVTADFNVPLNNDNGPDSLRDIGPSLDVAEILGCDLIRICIKKAEDIPFARQSADRAAERGIRLAHQCHTTSLFEQVDQILATLAEIDRPDFGIIYEPANLMLCGQNYGPETLARLRPHIMNVYVQNHRLNADGEESLPTYCLGDVRFDHLPVWAEGGIDTASMFAGLGQIGYDRFFTIHQAQGIKTLNDAKVFAKRCAQFVRDREQ